jgi:hypothetical protein
MNCLQQLRSIRYDHKKNGLREMKRALTFLVLSCFVDVVLADSNPFLPPVVEAAPEKVVSTEACMGEADRKMMEELSTSQSGDKTELKATYVALVNGEEVWFDGTAKKYFRKKAAKSADPAAQR